MEKITLNDEEQVSLCNDLFGSYDLLEFYIGNGGKLCEEAQNKLFSLEPPHNKNLILLYIEQGNVLCEEAEEKLFELPMSEVIVNHYCFGLGNCLKPKSQLKLLSMPEKVLAKRYIRNYQKTPYLCAEFVNQAETLGLM